MSRGKKSLYELLGVTPDATDAEIRRAYEQHSESLKTPAAGGNPEDQLLQLKVLTLAFRTLSSPGERAAYDAKLASPALSLVPLDEPADAMALRAEALTLRAEAITLRAEALSMRGARVSENRAFGEEVGTSPLTSTASLLRKVLTVLGTLVAIALVARVLVILLAGSNERVAPDAENKAREKVILQDYYQTHGVRPANLAEMELMEAERRRHDREGQEAQKLERDKARAEELERRNAEASQRRAEEVSAQLRADERAHQNRMRYEDERAAREKADALRKEEWEERRRAQRQEAEWRQVLRR